MQYSTGNTRDRATLFNHISSAADTTAVPAYDDIDTMTATLQHLHMSELLHHDEDAVDPDGKSGTSGYTIGRPT